ncbi:hypothetical protein SDC9_164603 [bioreactor metagenome]|uniref:Glycoside hydrolase 123-like N-terminal domain-containing protein n=1 Tax=bioreactor metagenome TaxID=1076179 RepID=A0A645FS40_9ZZZZ
MRKIYQILWDFGKAEADTVFTGYWEKNLPFTVDNPKLLVSSYVRKNKVLLVIGNYGGDSENTIRLKMPVRSVINAETGEKLPTYDREVRFPLKKHDFLLMEVSL